MNLALKSEAAPAQIAERILALSTRAPRRSLSLARRSLVAGRRLEPAQRARLLRAYGHALRAAGDYRAARAAYHESRRLYLGAGQELEHAVAALGLIDACMYLGRTAEALRAADTARAVFLRERDVRRLAMLETNLGNLHHQREDLALALEHYDRAARLLAPIGTPVQVASLDHNRANVLTHLGRREEAEALYRHALGALLEAEEPVLAAQVRYGLACLHFLHGEYASAIVELEEVRPQLQRLGARPLLALADLDLAEVLVAMRLFPEARALAQSARAWFRSRRATTQEARCLLVQALSAAGMGLEREARRAAAAADRRFARLRHPAGRALADLIKSQLDLQRGRTRTAAIRALRARRAFLAAGFPVRALAAAALAVEAELEAGAWQRVRALTRAMLHARPRPGDAFSRMRLARAEGAACAQLGDAAGALAAYREAIDHSRTVHESQFVDEWRVGFLGGEPALLDESLGVLLARRPRPRPAEIWSWIARATRARQPAARAPGECSPAVARQIARLRSELEACYAQLWRLGDVSRPATRALAAPRLERRALQLEGRLRRLAGAGPGAGARPGAPRRPRRSPRAGEGSVTLTFFSAGGRLGALREDERGQRLFTDLMATSELELRVQLLHHQMDLRAARLPTMADHEAELRARSRQHLALLGRALLEPLLGDGPLPPRLVIAPWGALYRVPFHALLWRDAPLAATCEVSIRLDPWSAGDAPGPARAGAWLIAFDPDGGGAILDEARPVAERLAAGGVPVAARLGAGATREAVVEAARGAELIHIAGHATYRAMHPEFSALRLADGCFNARDFAALDLRGATVVLSACETGPRAVGAGHETLGLVRGLVRAGARTVLASLWRVDDRATSGQMQILYDRWSEARSLGEAWRQAQVRSAVASDDPFLWAAFSLFGDPHAGWPGQLDARPDSGKISALPPNRDRMP